VSKVEEIFHLDLFAFEIDGKYFVETRDIGESGLVMTLNKDIRNIRMEVRKKVHHFGMPDDYRDGKHILGQERDVVEIEKGDLIVTFIRDFFYNKMTRIKTRVHKVLGVSETGIVSLYLEECKDLEVAKKPSKKENRYEYC